MFKMNRILGGIVSAVFLAAFILTACGGASASKTPGEVQITVEEFKITSSLTTFQVGVPYNFVVTNKGTMPHEILIMPPTTADMTADQIQALKASALDGITGDDLTAGATKTMTYTFTKAYPAGSLEFACHLPGHYEAGMKLPIVVQQEESSKKAFSPNGLIIYAVKFNGALINAHYALDTWDRLFEETRFFKEAV